MPKGPQGQAYWQYDDEAGCWYVGLNERASPPYRRQIVVEAVLDLDDDGRLAGIELVTPTDNGNPILPPAAAEKSQA